MRVLKKGELAALHHRYVKQSSPVSIATKDEAN